MANYERFKIKFLKGSQGSRKHFMDACENFCCSNDQDINPRFHSSYFELPTEKDNDWDLQVSFKYGSDQEWHDFLNHYSSEELGVLCIEIARFSDLWSSDEEISILTYETKEV